MIHDQEQRCVEEYSLNENVEVTFLQCLSSLETILFIVLIVSDRVHNVHNVEEDEVESEPFIVEHHIRSLNEN